MRKYRKGYIAELRARDELTRLGAKLVVRSAGSRTPADLVAFFPSKKEVWLVQVKARELSEGEVQKLCSELRELVGDYRCRIALFAKRKGRYLFVVLS